MLDIVVPVYNEGDNIKMLLDQLAGDVKSDKRIFVIYDFEEDTTVPVLRLIKDDYSFEIIMEKNHYGKGVLNALKSGLEASTAGIVLVIMADLSDSLDVVDRMKEMMNAGADVVCASRYMRGGQQIGGPFLKKLFSYIAGVTLHYLIRIPTHDISNNFRMYSRKVIERFSIESSGGFELAMELTIKAYVHGMMVTETPSRWYDRVAGQSNFKMWKWLPKYLHWYFYGIKKTWFGYRRRHIKK